MKSIQWTLGFGLLMLLAGCSSGPYQASASALQQRAQVLAQYGTAIVPGQSIGPIRVGMGMDQVQALLGQPDGTQYNPSGVVDVWRYISMNLYIMFTDSPTPTVRTVTTEVYTKSEVTFGEQTWDDGYPVQTVYKTANGIQLGSTSFDVQRAYGSGYADLGGEALMMIYQGQGISFRVTRGDKRVVSITVGQL